ncbi:MAG: beta-ketoacyl synthase N-terminal-like domain-containing protein [Chitinophagaceae bacterium]
MGKWKPAAGYIRIAGRLLSSTQFCNTAMMKDVFIVSDNIISPVGNTTEANFIAVLNNQSGIKEHVLPAVSPVPFYAALFEDRFGETMEASDGFTKFEQLLLLSIGNALQNSGIDITDSRTILIISSTKGNIALLENNALDNALKADIGLSASAKKLARYFKLANTPLVVSNACISGPTALLTGKRLLQMGKYLHAVVAGADVISSFVLSGFQSFQAISAQPCKPFDAARNGINLGEAAATIILSAAIKGPVKLSGGAVTNDANHISGPSRSGQELCIAINRALQQAQVKAADLGFISAHGTATVYNDEMEAKAFSLAGMETIPVNSLKGYYGHTLGAAGIVESAIAIHSLQQNKLIATRGFQQRGVSVPVNVCKETMEVHADHFLKTAAGFGGCNAALVFSKTHH